MDFTFTEDQLAFREAISRFLMTEAPPEMLRDIWETDEGRSAQLRSKMAQQGLTALCVPEAQGGLGMDDIVWSLLTQELGYYAIPDSLADTAYVAASFLRDVQDDSPLRSVLLERIAEGRFRVAVGHSVNRFVADAHLADVLLLEREGSIYLVERSTIDLEHNQSIDSSRRLFRISWNPDSATCLADSNHARQLWSATLNRGALAVAGQSLGLAQRMLDLSVDYVVQRKQFGKPIGSFQAIKHHLADVAGKIEFAKPVLYRAAHALANGDSQVEVHVSHAKLACCEAAGLAARHGIQVHGAMGYTWEVDLQMFMKRAWALDSAWGDRAFHKSRVATAILADGAAVGPQFTFEE